MNSSTSDLSIAMSLAPPGPADTATHFTTINGNFSDLANATKYQIHSPIVWKNGVRKGSNYLCCQVLVLDVDGTWSFGEAKGEFKDTRHVLIATSKSHQMSHKINEHGQQGKNITPADYFHIYIGLEKPITDKEEYLEVMKGLVNHYPVDNNVKDAARFFFPNPNQMYWYS